MLSSNELQETSDSFACGEVFNFSFCQDRVKSLTTASFAIQFNPSPAERKELNTHKTFKYMVKT